MPCQSGALRKKTPEMSVQRVSLRGVVTTGIVGFPIAVTEVNTFTIWSIAQNQNGCDGTHGISFGSAQTTTVLFTLENCESLAMAMTKSSSKAT